MIDNQIDSSNLLTSLHESEPEISLEELQHFLANAPAKPNMTIRYSVVGLSVSAIALLLIFFVFPRGSERVRHNEITDKTSIAPSNQTRAYLGGNENIAQSKSTNPSNHKLSHSTHKNFIAPGEIANDLIPVRIDACSIPSETSTTPALSSDFTQPTLLCSNTSSPQLTLLDQTQPKIPFMKNNMTKHTYSIVFSILSIALAFYSTAALAQPTGEGWYPAGSKPNDYKMGVSTEVRHNDKPSAYIKSKHADVSNGFGTYMQTAKADDYLGKSVRMSAWIQSKDINGAGWAGMWFRVDGDSAKKMLSFDNMGDRPIKGTTKWTKYETVLDVPAGAKDMAFGVLLYGGGEVYFTDVNFEILGPANGKTGMTGMSGLPAKPKNLDFEK